MAKKRTYEQIRADIRARAQHPPFGFSPGLAHVVATVREPRSDEAARNPDFDRELKQLQSVFRARINDHLPSDVDASLDHYGGEIEHIADEVAADVSAAARRHGAADVVERLERLRQERRLGICHLEDDAPVTTLSLDLAAVPRSSTSQRRVGLWR